MLRGVLLLIALTAYASGRARSPMFGLVEMFELVEVDDRVRLAGVWLEFLSDSERYKCQTTQSYFAT
jgi:hypothetical protein